MSEEFIYLDYTLGTHFFYHEQQDKFNTLNFIHSLSVHLYNPMITKGYIKKNDLIVVFNKLFDNTFMVSCAYHLPTKTPHYTEELLKNLFFQSVEKNIKRNNFLVISFENKQYVTYDITEEIFNENVLNNIKNINISDIKYGISLTPIG